MIFAVETTAATSVFEIGCGDGVLTRAILESPVARLFVFEIDPDWAHYVEESIDDQRLQVFLDNFVDIDLAILKDHVPWTVLSNLPYKVTFPILHRLRWDRHLL